MRITAGSLRGRQVKLPKVDGVRPTPAKVRQALFNILGDVTGWRVLDLFAGSGLMAMEAISRGAAQVVSIERNRRVCRHLQQVRKAWQLAERWQVMMGEVHGLLAQLAGAHFDLVFADPPYARGFAASIPARLDECGITCDVLVIEEAARAAPSWPPGWTAVTPRRYGDTCLYILHPEEA